MNLMYVCMCYVCRKTCLLYVGYVWCIEEEQVDFQWKYACIDQVFILNSIVRNRMQEGKGMYALFIDMQKCFDWVDRDLLLYRLLSKHITGKFYHSVKALYNTSASTIRINNRCTNQFQIKACVKQGEELSPQLCTLFLLDLSEVIKKAKLGIPCRNLMVSLLLYTDDIVIFVENPENMQCILDIIEVSAESAIVCKPEENFQNVRQEKWLYSSSARMMR